MSTTREIRFQLESFDSASKSWVDAPRVED